MVLFHHVAHHGRGFAVRAVGSQPCFQHPEQDAALYGFQPVADVRQRPADDDGHGVIEVGGLHLLLDGLGNDARFVGQCHLRHLKKDGNAGTRERETANAWLSIVPRSRFRYRDS